MKNFITMLLAITLVACATARQVYVPTEEEPTMKQPVPFALRAILSIVLTTFSLQAWGLDCAPASINLVNQAEVDALSVTGCTTVIGGLGVATGSITSLEGLSVDLHPNLTQ